MAKVRLADFVVDWLVKKGIADMFLVSGGGIMHLVDAVGKNRRMNYLSTHHEQACAVAAESWARINNKPGVCLVTTGPGATNALTGVAGAYMDSIPMLVISGQVRSDILADYSKQRQIGPQEGNTVPTVEHNTKYAKLVLDPKEILYELDKSYYIAMSGRPGPVWLDIPLNIQATTIDTSTLKKFVIPKARANKNMVKQVATVITLLQKAKRPILVLGGGVRSSGITTAALETFINRLGAPVVAPYSGLDLIAEKHPLSMGRFGPVGQRRANFALQNSDLMISIGTGLSIAAIGFNFAGFAPKAKKVMVNIDPGELSKPTISVDLGIEADAKDFMREMLRQLGKTKLNYDQRWSLACAYWKKKYKTTIPEFYEKKNYVNPYVLFDKLSEIVTQKDVIVTGNSLDAVCMLQSLKVQKNQRAFTNSNWGAMGWCLPGSIGAAIGSKKRTILVTGDGSIQFNIHELGTISHYNLPIKIFIVNNDGYESIRATQETHFAGNYVGSNVSSGVTNPNFKYLAKAYSIPYLTMKRNNDIEKITKEALRIKGPVIIDMKVDPEQHRVPRVSSFKRPDGTMESRPLEDMWPFLPREELKANMSMFEDDK